MCDEKHKQLYTSCQNFIEHLNTVIKNTVFNNQICIKEIFHPTYEMVYDIIHPELHTYINTPIIDYDDDISMEDVEEFITNQNESKYYKFESLKWSCYYTSTYICAYLLFVFHRQNYFDSQWNCNSSIKKEEIKWYHYYNLY